MPANLWQPGEISNPAGRVRGSRNKLSEEVICALLRDFRKHGEKAIAKVRREQEAAKMPFPIHPHMLRHACGSKLANDGHDTRALQHYLGHKNIQHTVRYTEMAPDR